MNDDIIAGLDIGSTEVRLVVGQKIQGESGDRVQIIGAVSVPSEGINKGIVNSIEDVTSSISACLEKAERLVGVPISSVWVGINGPHIKCERSKGVVAVSKSDNEIGRDDVERAIEAARALSVPPNYEILHVIPVKYIVDNQEDVKDPIGMIGVRLEVEALIIQGLSSQVNNLTKAIYRTGLGIDDLVLSPLAAAEAVISTRQKDLGAVLVNIGSSTTSVAVFEEGELLHTAILAIGSEHITADIAIGLRCPINLAERIKLEHGSANPENFGKKDEIDISEMAREENADDDSRTISRKYVSEIIEARTEEIFKKVDDELRKVDRSGMLPAGAFIVGGGAKLTDIIDVAKKQLRLPACIGINKSIPTIIEKVNEQNYLTALGLVVWGNQFANEDNSRSVSIKKTYTNTVKKIKDIFSKFKP